MGRGLVAVDPATADTLVAFAAKEGTTADDGASNNSPFTTALLKHLTTPGLDIRIALGRVRDEVRAATERRQEPFVYGSLGGDTVAIVNAPTTTAPSRPSTPPQSAPQDEAAARAWTVIQGTTSEAVLEDFIRQFHSTPYGSMARARLQELKKAKSRWYLRRSRRPHLCGRLLSSRPYRLRPATRAA